MTDSRRTEKAVAAPCAVRGCHYADVDRLRVALEAASSPEVCICAAVRTTDGEIVRGHRHADCLIAAGRRGKVVHHDGQGFVTSRNRFVDRVEARRLQEAAGIESIDPGGYRSDVLFSEDLY
jgi:hypothetical protein